MKKFAVLLMMMCLAFFTVACGSDSSSDSSSNEPNESSEADYSKVEKTWELSDGFYTAGIDIPAGTFDVTAIAGIGYISSDNDSANLRAPNYPEEGNEDYSTSFKNYSLSEGERLEVRSLVVKLDYSEVTSDVTGRSYDEDAGVELSAGNYVVGKDLTPGVYCIKFISGDAGYVSSDSGSLNSNMDGDPETDDYFDYISNAELGEGETIEVTSGLKVLFIPEK